jgi:hypothetical protein
VYFEYSFHARVYQVHAALKRYLRRKQVNELLLKDIQIPTEVNSLDLGYDISQLDRDTADLQFATIDPIDYKSGLGMIFAARPIQSSSSNFWLYEYIRQKVEDNDSEVMFESIVLGCVDNDRFQYAIYVYELGWVHKYLVLLLCLLFSPISKSLDNSKLNNPPSFRLEHRYLSENGKLDEGQRLWLKVSSVNPRLELLTFSLASKSGGIHHAQSKKSATRIK